MIVAADLDRLIEAARELPGVRTGWQACDEMRTGEQLIWWQQAQGDRGPA